MSQLDVKLSALLNKDLDALVFKQAKIPTLGATYTKEQLEAFVQSRVNVINQIKASKNPQKDFNSKKSALSSKDKLIIDAILNDAPHAELVENADDYNKVIELILYNLAL